MTVATGLRLAVREGRIERSLVTFMALGFLALLLTGIAAAWVARENAVHTRWVTHTFQVELSITNTRRLIEQGETARRGALLAPQVDEFRDVYRTTGPELRAAMTALGVRIDDNPAQAARMRALVADVAVLTALRDRSIALVGAGRADAAVAGFRDELSAGRMRRIRALLSAMTATERRLLAVRDAGLERTVQQFYVILALAAFLLGAVAVVSYLAIARYTQDLSASRDSLALLNDNLEAIVADRTRDLSRANEELQRFAYIVSHDLRSPLVNVMGFTAELDAAAGDIRALIDRVEEDAPHLVDAPARLAAREDLPEAIGFIRTSTQKMDRLINAILTLSRQGRRTLAAEPLDLEQMVDGIRQSLAHRLDAAGATVAVEGALPAIASDRLAVEQILSNLIENSVKYLRPDVPGRIVVTGGRHGARAWIAVADNGRGIDPRDHERVFDLFRRSGVQDTPGEGIGLAHVRALAYRLGGVIDLASQLGDGATFRLSLPVTFEPEEHRQ